MVQSLRRQLVAVCVCLVAAGCGGLGTPSETGTEGSTAATTVLPTVLSTVLPAVDGSAAVVEGAGIVTLVASETTMAWLDDTGLVHRATRQVFRCRPTEWVPFGPPVAASYLFDVDDTGTIYVFPGEPHAGAIQVGDEGSRESTVYAVSSDDEVSEVVYAGRGVWTFGVARDGSALWVSACGPTGIFHRPAPGHDGSWQDLEMMPAPSTSWQQRGGVIDAAGIFWSLDGDRLVGHDASGLRYDVDLSGPAAEVKPCGGDVCAAVASDGARAVVRVRDGVVMQTTTLPASATTWAVSGLEVLAAPGAFSDPG